MTLVKARNGSTILCNEARLFWARNKLGIGQPPHSSAAALRSPSREKPGKRPQLPMGRCAPSRMRLKMSDPQVYLQAMYKEQCDQARQHEVMRQQSTTLILTLSGVLLPWRAPLLRQQ